MGPGGGVAMRWEEEGDVEDRRSTGMARRTLLGRVGRAGLGVVGVGSLMSILDACAPTGAPAATATGAASAAPTAAPAAHVKVQLLWIKNTQFAGLYAAERQGFLKAENLTQEIIPGGPQVNAIQSVAGGAAPIGLIGSSHALIQARANGIPVKAIAAQYQTGPFGLISLAERPIKTIRDAIGRKVGLQAGARPTFAQILAANDISADKMTIVPVGIDPTPLVTGQVDGYWGSATGQVLDLKSKGIQTVMLLASDAGLSYYGNVVFTLDTVLAQQEDMLIRWLRATIRGWQYAIAPANVEEMARITVDQSPELKLNLSVETAQCAAQVPFMTSALTKTKGLMWLDPSDFGKQIEINIKTGQITSRVSVEDVVTTKVLEKAYGGKTSL